MIEALQAELDMSPVQLGGKPAKLAPLVDQKKKEEERGLEEEKERQRSLLNSLTFDLMNPACLVAQGNIINREARKEIKLQQSKAIVRRK